MITTAGIAVPEDMAATIDTDEQVRAAFEALRPEDQRNFVNWLARPGAQNRHDKLAELNDRIRHHQPRPAPTD